jgi:hypothetical protein
MPHIIETIIFIGAQMPNALAIPIRLVPTKAHHPLTAQIKPPRNGNQNVVLFNPSYPTKALTTIAMIRTANVTKKVRVCCPFKGTFCEGAIQLPQASTVIIAKMIPSIVYSFRIVNINTQI